MNIHHIVHVLRHVPDPELGLDIVTLGLVYGIEADDERIHVRLTTTTPTCPMGGAIQGMVERALQYSYPEHTIKVELVSEPPWHPEMA
mgnify:FL=1